MARKRLTGRDHHLVVRPMEARDIPELVELQRRCFPGIPPWTEEHFLSQMERFGEGQIVVEFDGRIVATSSSLIVSTSAYARPHTFNDVSGGGYIHNHDPDGDALYGIDIAVDPEYRGLRLARRIYDARKDVISRHNLRRFLIAGRIPGYRKHADEMSAEEYVRKVVTKELKDPVLTTQLSNGFAIRRVLADYMPSDAQSRGHAVFMEWLSTDYMPPGQAWNRGTARVVAVQYQMRHVDTFGEFARQVEFFVDAAADLQADFLLFPELLTNQLQSLVAESRPGLTARRLSEFTHAYEELFHDLAIRYNVNIISGTILSVEDDELYNVAYLFRRDGTMGKQYKVHISPDEARWWGVKPGNRIEVFETDRGKVAIVICYDIEFPELARVAKSKGANILFVPYSTSLRSAYLRVRYCAQARCIENNVYCVLAGSCGNLPQVEGADIHYAESCILTPSEVAFSRDGIGAIATPNVETVVVHDLDFDLLQDSGSVEMCSWVDRRDDIYKLTYREDGVDGSV